MTIDRLKKEVVDQGAHMIAAALIVICLATSSNLLQCVALGFACGFIRELTEEGTPTTLATARAAIRKSPLDLSFWTLGGLIGWLILEQLK